MHKRFTLFVGAALLLPLAALTSGCGKSATGQVAAVVNGEEISLQELNAEVAQAKVPEGADKNAVRNQALQRIVDRRIVAQQAKEAGLDRDPDYLIRQRQLDEQLLLELYAKKTGDTLRIPDAAAVTKFIAEHPQAFAGRTIYDVDQIRFAAPADASVLKSLESAHSMAAVAAALKAKGVQFDQGKGKIDSAQVPPEMLAQVSALPAGEPFIVPNPQGVVVSVITGRTAAPMPDAQARPLAAQAIRNQELGKLLEQRLKDGKAKAKVEYQPGFGPAPAAKPTPAART